MLSREYLQGKGNNWRGRGSQNPLGRPPWRRTVSTQTAQDGSKSGRRRTAGSAQHTQREPLQDVSTETHHLQCRDPACSHLFQGVSSQHSGYELHVAM